MGWEDVWRVAMKVYVAEPVELRILIGLGLLFLALLVVVGLKYAFRTAEPQAERRPLEPSRQPVHNFASAPLALAEVTPLAAKSVVQPLRVSKVAVRAARKSAKQTIKPFAPPRPKIHRGGVAIAARQSRFTQHAPYSPLSPRGRGDVL